MGSTITLSQFDLHIKTFYLYVPQNAKIHMSHEKKQNFLLSIMLGV